jgi:DNA-binding NarL/FixJ family response regulator
VELGRCIQGLAEVSVLRGAIPAAVAQLNAAIAGLEPHAATPYLRQARARLEELPGRSSVARVVYPDRLSAREVEVLRLVTDGKTNAEVGETLVISPGTVGRHVSNILNKTGLANRTQLARYATERGLQDG